jgi:hypothetical protein
MDELPTLRQLLVCEKVIFEQGSGNVSLINCHSVRRAERFPTKPVDFIVYGLLTNGFGPFTLEFRINRPDTDGTIFQRFFPMLVPDRLRSIDFVCRLNDFVFPGESIYEILLLAGEELLGMTTLELKE